MNKVVIIVRGGIVQAVHAQEDLKIVIIDHDNLEDTPKDEILSMAEANYSPDTIGMVDEIISGEIDELKQNHEL